MRFALTSEAGLNDGMAFPFVQAAILLAASGPFAEWGVRWFAWDLVGKVVIGAALGIAVGWALAKVAFRSNQPSLRTADSGEPLLALAAVLLAYGLTEVADGYGFLAVFACAMTLRSAERGHDYHALMHDVIERLERLLTLIVLLLLGVALTNGLLADLTWQAALVAVLLLLVVRPVSGLIALFAGVAPTCASAATHSGDASGQRRHSSACVASARSTTSRTPRATPTSRTCRCCGRPSAWRSRSR